MSASSKPPASATIGNWLAQATARLSEAGIGSARLDALILLEDVLGRDRSWVLAHQDKVIADEHTRTLNTYIAQRAGHIPLAYLRGHVEFYGRRFTVTPDVLIPRPETEELVELALTYAADSHRLIDVGTGSGAIAITLALERPDLRVEASDISKDALAVAAANAERLGADVRFIHSDVLDRAAPPYQLIVANLPYVGKGYEISPEARAEPELALFAEDGGYHLIERLIPQAADALSAGGYLLLESDPWQQDRLIQSATAAGFSLVDRRRFHLALQKR